MTTVTVIYPNGPGARFDFEYYKQTHLPLLMERWGAAGLDEVEALRGTVGADGGEPPFLAQALLRFSSTQSFQAAASGEHAPEIFGDIPNFTNVQPIVQVNEQIRRCCQSNRNLSPIDAAVS